MRIIPLFALVLGSLLLTAQEPTTQIKKVPAPYTSAASGKDMYKAYCASCHGIDAKGDGPAAPALKQQPTDLTLLAQQKGGKFPTTTVEMAIWDATDNVHGSKDMPVWGPTLTRVSGGDVSVAHMRVNNLTHYLETLQVK